jgi:divalent metal cation (Fe/Co/Zn/Cd) transporter
MLELVATAKLIHRGSDLQNRPTSSHKGHEFSLAGVLVTGAAVPMMYFLAKNKTRVAERIGSRALRVDAVESLTCGPAVISRSSCFSRSWRSCCSASKGDFRGSSWLCTFEEHC